MARLELQYNKELRKKIQNELNLSNPMEVPKITKITLNMGVGEAVATASPTPILSVILVILGTSIGLLRFSSF